MVCCSEPPGCAVYKHTDDQSGEQTSVQAGSRRVYIRNRHQQVKAWVQNERELKQKGGKIHHLLGWNAGTGSNTSQVHVNRLHINAFFLRQINWTHLEGISSTQWWMEIVQFPRLFGWQLTTALGLENDLLYQRVSATAFSHWEARRSLWLVWIESRCEVKKILRKDQPAQSSAVFTRWSPQRCVRSLPEEPSPGMWTYNDFTS